jgi:5-methylcytosine-specific restriction endonuclease McrA
VVEHFSHEEIAERDDWACHICGELVTRENWSVDHLVPLSLEGEHTRENVKLAHHACNASRGNRDRSYLTAAAA